MSKINVAETTFLDSALNTNKNGKKNLEIVRTFNDKHFAFLQL